MRFDPRPLYLRAAWSTAYVNDLPDSAFLLITPGGTKTAGKTDGAHRFFPVYDSTGALDDAHLNNALARIPQASTLTADQRASAMNRAKALEAKTNPDGKYSGAAGSGRSRDPLDELPGGALDFQVRVFPLVGLQVRGAQGRTLVGRAVPYNVTAQVYDRGRTYNERMLPGVFARQLGLGQVGHVKLYDSHTDRLSDKGRPIGKTVGLSDQRDGLYGEWELLDTTQAEDALKLVNSGMVTGLSVGFQPGRGSGTRRGDDGALERVSGHLDHVALTDSPTYPEAQVLSVRAQHALDELDADRERLRAVLL